MIDVNTNAYTSQEYSQYLRPSLVIENVPVELKGSINVDDLNRAFNQALQNKSNVSDEAKPDLFLNQLKTVVKTKQYNNPSSTLAY